MPTNEKYNSDTFRSGEDTTDYRDTWRHSIRPSAAKHPCLTAMNGPLLGRTFSIGMGRLIIGREGDCELVVNDDGVSRRHALILRKDDGRVCVEDLRSTNGTAMDGR